MVWGQWRGFDLLCFEGSHDLSQSSGLDIESIKIRCPSLLSDSALYWLQSHDLRISDDVFSPDSRGCIGNETADFEITGSIIWDTAGDHSDLKGLVYFMPMIQQPQIDTGNANFMLKIVTGNTNITGLLVVRSEGRQKGWFYRVGLFYWYLEKVNYTGLVHYLSQKSSKIVAQDSVYESTLGIGDHGLLH